MGEGNTDEGCITMKLDECLGLMGYLFGHKYQSVYNETSSAEFPARITNIQGSPAHMEALKNRKQSKDYLHTQCNRCGRIILVRHKQ